MGNHFLHALRMMLKICCNYASKHGLEFNSSKSQLICFRKSSRCTHPISIYMNGQLLRLSDEVCHLGHILSFNLCDRNDIPFNCVDPSVKSFLMKSFCLSLYGCNIWSLSSPGLNILQVAVNHLLSRIWRLYTTSISQCHLSLSLSLVPAITNQVMKRFLSLYSTAMSSSSPLVKAVFPPVHPLPSLLLVIISCMVLIMLGYILIVIFLNASFIFDIRKRFPFISPFYAASCH